MRAVSARLSGGGTYLVEQPVNRSKKMAIELEIFGLDVMPWNVFVIVG
jgi:hypothetical protein